MKKLVALLTGAALLTISVTAFAKTDSCPDIYTIRDAGSTLSTAFHHKDKVWIASSSPFIFNDAMWQTHFIEPIPTVSDASTALIIAQEDLNKSSLMSKPKVYGDTGSGSIMCDYSPEGANYHVIAGNSVDVGYKKLI